LARMRKFEDLCENWAIRQPIQVAPFFAVTLYGAPICKSEGNAPTARRVTSLCAATALVQ
jgi:hypothetical protein